MNEDVELKTCTCGRKFYAWIATTRVCVVCFLKEIGVSRST
jgi:hypothetical protein